jgi:hypothetical protein
MIKKLFCCTIVLIGLHVHAQSILETNVKADYLAQLKGKSIMEIKELIVKDSIELSKLIHMLNSFEEMFTVDDKKKYTEANAEITEPYKLPILKDVEDNFNNSTQSLVFKQQYQLPNSGFFIEPSNKEDSRNGMSLDYNVKNAYRNGQLISPDAIRLLRIDSVRIYTEYDVPTKITVVKMLTTQKKIYYKNDTITLDYVNKNNIKFHLPNRLKENLLEVHALTTKGKLIDSKSSQYSSFKDDKQATKKFERFTFFFKSILTDITANKFSTTDELLRVVDTKLNNIEWITQSEISYQQYSFKGNVQSLVFYFKEEGKLLKKENIAINVDNTKTGFTVFENEAEENGICDFTGKIIIPAAYKKLKQENENYYYTWGFKKEGGYETVNYFLDASKNELINLNFNGLITAQDGEMAQAQITIGKDKDSMPIKNYGMYNNKRKLILPIKYDFLQVMNNVIAYREIGSKTMGLFNLEGKKITDEQYSDIAIMEDYDESIKHNIIIAEKNEKFGFLDMSGNPIKDFRYNKIYKFSEGLAVAYIFKDEGRKACILDSTMTEIIPLKYESLSNCENGIMIFELNEKYGLLNRTGDVIIKNIYSNIKLSGGFAIAENDKYLFGCIDNKGKIIIPFIFKEISEFNAGYAFVFTENSYGIIDTTGKFMMKEPRPSSYGLSTNWEGTARTYLLNGKKYNYKGDLIK